MRVDPVWAANYVFLDELWRGRERVLYDPSLGELLLGGQKEGLAWDNEGRAREILEELLASDQAPVWLLFDDIAAVSRSGIDTNVLGARGLEEGAWLLKRRPWETAILDIGGLRHFDATARRPPGRPGVLWSFLEELGAQVVEGDRVAILWARSEDVFGEEGMSYPAFCAWADRFLPRAGAYGLAATAVVQGFGLGNVSGRASAQGGGEPAIDIDNRLGSESPKFSYYVAVAGLRLEDTITIVELPAGALDRPPTAPAAADASARGELDAAQARLVELGERLAEGEKARMELLRELDQTSTRLSELEEELEDLSDAPGAAQSETNEEHEPSAHAEASQPQARSAGDAAQLQQALWELEQLKSQIAGLRARPVDVLEAENAQLRAENEKLRGSLTGTPAKADDSQTSRVAAYEDEDEDEDADAGLVRADSSGEILPAVVEVSDSDPASGSVFTIAEIDDSQLSRGSFALPREQLLRELGRLIARVRTGRLRVVQLDRELQRLYARLRQYRS